MLKGIRKNNNYTNPLEGREGLVYARVSSKRQAIDGSGLESQEGRCIKELQGIGVPYVKTFPDSYTGGGDFMNRPAMREMLAYIDSHPHKKFLVVFDDLKRLARDTEYHLKLRALFKVKDVVLKCLNYNFEDSPESRFVETVLASGAELERHQNRRQVVQKQKARLELGYWAFPSQRPYKMEKDPIHGRILKLQYPEADWLKEAMEGFATGRFLRKIDVCRFLVEKGFWTKQRPERYIDKITDMLKDPLFAGYIEYPEWEVERRKGHHEALITLDTYNLIQKRLKNEGLNKRIRKDISEDFPARGLSLCYYCSKPLTATWSRGRNKKFAYYFCQNKNCEFNRKSIRREDIEQSFKNVLKRQKLKTETSLLIEETFEGVWKEEVSDIKKIQVELGKKKIELESRISELTALVIGAKVQSVRDAYERQIESLANEIANLADNSVDSDDFSVPYRTAIEKVTDFLVNPYDVWEKLDVREQQNLFYFVFDQKIPYDLKEGYRTDRIPCATRLFSEFVGINTLDVEMPGIEPGCKR